MHVTTVEATAHERDRRTHVRRERGRLLPHGTPLPDDVWMTRHRSFLIATWLVCLATFGWATVAQGVGHALLDCLPIAAAALLGSLATIGLGSRPGADAGAGGGVDVGAGAGSRRWRREAASSAVMLALMTASAAAVHLSHGLTEAHFLFFVAVGAGAAYQTWAPFLTAIGFVVLHHGVLASAPGHPIFNHPAAQEHPWRWALVHGGLLALAAAVGVASWRADELVRGRLSELGARSRLIVGTVADGIVALDEQGRVLEANPAALQLLAPVPPARDPLPGAARDAAPVTGRRLDELVDGYVPGPARAAGGHVSSRRGSVRRGDRCTPVAITVAPVPGGHLGEGRDDRVRAVVTLRDLSSTVRAQDAERALVDSTARERAQREDVAALSAAVRPPALRAAGLEAAVAYEPAASAPAGGDLYDWLRLPSGEVLLIVVDAMGRGTAATGEALAVTTTVRTLAVAGCPLGELVARAAAVLEVTHPELMATVLIAVLDPASGRLRLAGGGHPPAILVGADGAREITAEGRGIGYPSPGSCAVAEAVLAAGESLVLYTDGLVEGTRDIDAGLRELAGTAASLARVPVQEFVERLLTDVVTCARDDDDCLALVVRRPAA
ncbi:PAS domain-containing protein [Kineococcus radiotolerans]|uniref:PAS domain-containing protein n=1 Tax=Kineococcus radiotolerans TaxID=131568 RepID=A0A7W4XUW6_KINRA|nr:SpoIIE family protein phosphatase [Kineococcus radiotolerans]MBB2899386.1 PAS domain-containing protein [Kineococcus radiotolerans]